MLANPDWHEPVAESDSATVARLMDSFSAEQIAAAYLRLYRERHSAPEELADVNEPAKPRAAFGPSVWFSLAGGRAKGAEPRRLLPMLCKMGNVSREDIGAIRIQPDASLIELREAAVDGFLAAIGPAMTLEEGAALTRLAKPPKLDRGPRPDKPSEPKPRKPRAQDAAPAVKGKASETTRPVEWNDDPTPRVKKPKPGAKPPHGKKPRHGKDAPRAGSGDDPWTAPYIGCRKIRAPGWPGRASEGGETAGGQTLQQEEPRASGGGESGRCRGRGGQEAQLWRPEKSGKILSAL